MADIDSTLNSFSVEKELQSNFNDDVGEAIVSYGNDEEGKAAREPRTDVTHEAGKIGFGEAPKLGGVEAGETVAKDSAGGICSSSAPTAERTLETHPIITSTANTTPPATLKRFTSVNINRRFLEKTSGSSTSGTSNASVGQNTSKLSNTNTARSAQQQAVSASSRLVTAKLSTTLNGQPPLGWSRPGSATQPSVNGAQSPDTSSQTSNKGLTAPSVPRSRSTSRNGKGEASKLDTSAGSKAAWAKVTQPATSGPFSVQHDFPTAAEVAIGLQAAHLQQQLENQRAAEALAAQKRAMLQTADSFRGVHLDPNAHHWDEWEDEDADFLDDVIDFGDGRQYHIQAQGELEARADSEEADGIEATGPVASISGEQDEPVAKEDRFTDDIDRSWPRSQTGPTSRISIDNERASTSGTGSPRSSVPPLSPEKHATRALFNERSNKLEPLSKSYHPGSSRGGINGVRTEDRESKGVQVLQKGITPRSSAPPPRAWTGTLPKSLNVNGRLPSQKPPEERCTDVVPRQSPPNAWQQRSNVMSSSATIPRRPSESPAKRLPLPLPPPEQAAEVQEPQALTIERTSSKSIRSRHASVSTVDHSTTGEVAPAPVLEEAAKAGVGTLIDSEELVKATMLNAAERAKKRRMEEEAEREAQKERARKKAQELEARLATAEAEKAEKAERLERPKAVEQPPIPIPVDSEGQLRRPPFSSRGGPPITSTRPRGGSFTTSHAAAHSRPRVLFERPQQPPTLGSPADQTGSWRSAASPKAPEQSKEELVLTQQAQTSASRSHEPEPGEKLPATRALDEERQDATLPLTATVKIGSDEPDVFSILADSDGVDVIDFQDLGKLSGLLSASQTVHPVSDAPKSPREQAPPKETFGARRARPTAIDFVDVPPDGARKTTPALSQQEEMSWRRNAHPPEARVDPQPISAQAQPDSVARGRSFQERAPVSSQRRSDSKGHVAFLQSPTDTRPSFHSGSSRGHDRDSHFSNHPEKHLRSSSAQWRENSLSALNDTMSRIRGVLDGLHTQDAPTELLVTSKASPPKPPDQPVSSRTAHPIGYRQATAEHSALAASTAPITNLATREVFAITREGPPSMPKPAWNTFTVKLPRPTDSPEPLNKKQRGYFQIPYGNVNWGILTFMPSDQFTKRSLERDSALFMRVGKYRYRPPRIQLPTRRLINSTLDRRQAEAAKPLIPMAESVSTFRVQLPNMVKARSMNKAKGTWTFASSGASDASSWRRSRASVSFNLGTSLETRSRSPPPSSVVDTVPKVTLSRPSTRMSGHPRRKSEPRLPPGVVIAFAGPNGNPQKSFDPASSFVSFTVTSEIENPVVDPTETSTLLDPVIRPPDEHAKQVDQSSKAFDSITPPTPDRSISSLPGPATPWGKSPLAFSVLGSPSKLAPESDPVKAVWMQTADKADAPSGNSLKNIADDLTAIPFTLQDVKSEDGSTPPPQTVVSSGLVAPPSRMDVARAFQQVPESVDDSQTSSFSNGLSPSMGSLSSPPSMTNLPHYGSALIAHSPSPTLMYPHMPSMPSMQHIWQPANHQGTYVRAPAPGPYIVHTQHPNFSPYPPNTGVQIVYPATSMPHMQPVQGYVNGRGRGVAPNMSPVGARSAPVHGQPTSVTPMYIITPHGRPGFDPTATAFASQQQPSQNGLYTPAHAPSPSFPRPW